SLRVATLHRDSSDYHRRRFQTSAKRAIMKDLSTEQRELLRNFLTSQGLTFGPLLEEMLDHVSSDIEERMQQGLSFAEALHEMRNDIPDNHLQSIQIETMETINKRFSASRAL